MVLVSKIKNHKKPYIDFSLEELQTLKQLGISDIILSTMLDVTTIYGE